MSNKKQFKMTVEERRKRNFSESFKIKKVKEIELGKIKISELCKVYEISVTSVYQWLNKYGVMYKKKERIIVETESDTKQIMYYKKRVAELEQIVGQKQIIIDFKDRVIDVAEKEYRVDIKKKFSTV